MVYSCCCCCCCCCCSCCPGTPRPQHRDPNTFSGLSQLPPPQGYVVLWKCACWCGLFCGCTTCWLSPHQSACFLLKGITVGPRPAVVLLSLLSRDFTNLLGLGVLSYAVSGVVRKCLLCDDANNCCVVSFFKSMGKKDIQPRS